MTKTKVLAAMTALTVASTGWALLPDRADAAQGCFTPILHRGWTDAHTGENTLPAIRKSKGYGPAEVDVRLTQDDRMVLMHNQTVNKTTDGEGFVRDMTYAQIRQLRTVPGDARVPSFSQAARAATRHNVRLVVELKSFADWTPELLRVATRTAKRAGVTVWIGGRGYGFEHQLPNNAVAGTRIYWRPLKDVPASPANAAAHDADMVMQLSSLFTAASGSPVGAARFRDGSEVDG